MTLVPTEGVDMIEAEVEAAGPGEVRSIISAGLVNRSETHSNMDYNKITRSKTITCQEFLARILEFFLFSFLAKNP